MITVCIATFNGEKYIKEQLDSITHQLSNNDEIIISDDGSTDRTIEIISAFEDPRIQILHHIKPDHSTNSFYYTTLNFENALKHANGNYIFLADQDDIWMENKVNICLEILQENDLVLHDCCVVNKDNSVLSDSYFRLNNSSPGILKNIVKNSYLGCCMAFNTEVLKRALPFPKSEIPHDIWIGLIAEHYLKVNFCSDILVRYRRHESNLSPSGEKSRNSLKYKVAYRTTLITNFIKKLV